MKVRTAYRSLIRKALMVPVGMVMTLCATAQTGSISLTADRDHILPGERIVLTLESVSPSTGPRVDIPSLQDTFHHLEVLHRAEVKTEERDGNIIQRQQVTITGFDNGTFTIPALQVSAGKNLLHSDSLHVTVDVVKLTDSTYHDIRDIVETPVPATDWKRWGAIALSLIILAALVWNRLRGRKNKTAPVVTAAQRASAYAVAQQELKALRAEDLPGKGAMHAHYTRLYDILRNYLQRQGRSAAMQRTTDEWLIRLKPLLPTERFGPLAETLRIADAVKFARYPSSSAEAGQALGSVEAVIRSLHEQHTGLDQ